MDLEAPFVALMGCIITSFAPLSFEKKPAPALGTTPSPGGRRAASGSIAPPGPTHKPIRLDAGKEEEKKKSLHDHCSGMEFSCGI